MAGNLQFKTKHYHSMNEFETDRREMLSDGWVVSEDGSTPGKASYDYGGGNTVLDLLFLPILWLFNRTQPDHILHVRYVRPKN